MLPPGDMAVLQVNHRSDNARSPNGTLPDLISRPEIVTLGLGALTTEEDTFGVRAILPRPEGRGLTRFLIKKRA
jgi:hypothetical protein